MDINKHIQILISRYPKLEKNSGQIKKAYSLLLNTAKQKGTIYVCGNGGSNSDSQHIVGELLKSFKKNRRISHELVASFIDFFPQEGKYLSEKLEMGINALALGSQQAFSTAFANDVDPDLTFAQELWVKGSEEDSLICISTSGNSKNIKYAAMVGKILKMNVITLTGESKGTISDYSSCSISVAETETFKIQELHLPIYHCLCLALEDTLF